MYGIAAQGEEMVEFSLPIRVRWDLDFRERTGRAKRLARQIAEASPLVVELHVHGERGFGELPGVLAEIQKAGPKVTVHLGLSRDSAEVARRGYPVEFVWDVGPTAGFLGKLPDGASTVSFVPDADTLEELPEVISEFSESGLSELRLPNVNAVRAVAERGDVPVPEIGRIRAVAEAVSSRGINLAGKRLVAHDFFLWKRLRAAFPGATGDRVEFSGCQAGTALAYLDWEGNVYPCDSLPIRIGSLEETTLEEVWASPALRKIVAALRASPGACDGCGEYDGCRGGCRGMAFLSSGTFDAPDPACPEGRCPALPKGSSAKP